MDRSEIPLPGAFNAANVLAAACAAFAAGADAVSIREAVKAFRPIEHRLEKAAERRGASWYDDSIATTPESVLAALSAFEGGIVLIAGGYDKGLDYGAMAREAGRRARHVILLGATSARMEAALREAGAGEKAVRVESLEEAVRKAAELCAPGDAVLLSPGAASYDMFLNFRERGNRFKQLVRALRSPDPPDRQELQALLKRAW